MPFINLKTNAEITDSKAETIKSDFGNAISILPGKSESWLMVNIEDNCRLYFKGSADPAAMLEVSTYGKASDSALNELTGELTKIVSDKIGIPASRIYVKYVSTENWGWNGSNF